MSIRTLIWLLACVWLVPAAARWSCDFGSGALELARSTSSQDPYAADETIVLRRPGRPALPLPLPPGLYQPPTLALPADLHNRCSPTLGLAADTGRAYLLFADDRGLDGIFLSVAALDLEHWRALDGVSGIGRLRACGELPPALRQVPGGFDVRLAAPGGGPGCDAYGDEWVGVRLFGKGLFAGPASLLGLMELGIHQGGAGTEQRVAELKALPLVPPAPIRDRKKARRLNDQGLAALRGGDPAAAARLFEEGSRADPDDVELLNNLGYVQLLQRSPVAEASLRATLLRAPGRTGAWINLGQVYAGKGAVELATGCLAIGLRLSGNRAKTLAYLQQLAAKGDAPGTVEAVQHLLQQPWVQTELAIQGTGDTAH